ncbi:hypothetical protein [Ornithinimicrobium murale]|uniref:hypothetical protein n=1 Tax=Ornithinimicrobium murale TaxID=1050153 RepID=UPI0013B3E56E|nr:hypothetical protein [Ornithinimicrobium murale]
MSTHMTASAETAREAHRDPSGKFGHQPATESDTDLTTGTDLDRIITEQSQEIGEASTIHEEATKRLVKASLISAAAIIRKEYPNAQTMVLEDNDEGGIHWSAKDADGDEIDDLEEDDQLRDELWDCASGVEMNRSQYLAPYAKGHDQSDTGFVWTGAIEVDHDSGIVESMEVDIDEMLTRFGPRRTVSQA